MSAIMKRDSRHKYLWLLLTALATVGHSAVAEPAPGQANLVPNGDFEAGPSGAIQRGVCPTGWGRRFPGAGGLTIVPEARPGSAGGQCLRITADEERPTGGLFTRLMPLDPQKVLAVSGWMKGGGVLDIPQGAYFGVGWYDAARKPIVVRAGTRLNYTYLGSGYKKPEWRECRKVFLPCFEGEKETYSSDEIPSNAAFFDIRIFVLEYPRPAYFDDLFASQDIAKSDWIVGWEGTREAVKAARTLAATMSKVLGVEVAAAPWRGYRAQHSFVITDAKHAPADIAASLKGKRLDAFRIVYPAKLHGREVCLLAANEERACDFPVYHFLTKYMGVRWVGPDPLGEVLTSQPDWRMPARIDDLENPDYEHRYWSERAMNVRRWLAGSFRCQFHHNLWGVYDPKKYAGQPDLYPLYNGKRNVPDPKNRRQRVSGWQPCVGNPKAVKIAVQYGLDYLSQHPEHRSFSLSVNDGGAGICMCDACRALDSKDAFDAGAPHLTGRFFRFYNQVAARVLEHKPNAYLAALGYGRCQTLPVDTKVNPRILVFTVCDNDQLDMVQRQRDWRAAGARPCIYLWMWDCGYLTVRHYPHAVRDLARVSHSLGGFGFYCEALTNWAIGGPKFYVLSHVLWDTDSDVDKLLNEYLRTSFGPEAGPHLRTFFDRWEEIWERGGEGIRYNTGRDWRNPKQLERLTREDLKAMDTALEEARASRLTREQGERLGHVSTYYQWIRINADQYLVARALTDAEWVSARTPEEVMREVERGIALTPAFDAMWRETISADRTGWLLCWRYHSKPDELWTRLIAPIRRGVVAAFEPAIDMACDRISPRLLNEQARDNVIRLWTRWLDSHPQLGKWIKTQIHLLKHGEGENVLPNGDLERGTAGDPPAIKGWRTTGSWQGLLPDYGWTGGRNGSHAAAIGRGYAASWLTSAPTKRGHRYRVRAWYKTSGKRNRVFGTVAGAPLPMRPTAGKWQQATTTFTASGSSTPIRLNAYGQAKAEWTWFDDIEIVEICGK